MRILSGIQPSGALHYGNFVGAVSQFLRYQEQADPWTEGAPPPNTALYFIADLHALTSVRDGPKLASRSLGLAMDYLALGLDPTRAVLFRQSDVPEIPQLCWILSAITPMALMERGHSFKDKTAHGLGADVGLFTYPILMAADILLYGSDAVPVGKDQKQHLEFARDIATKFNLGFQPGYDPQDPQGEKSGVPGILKLPEPLILEAGGVVPGVDGQKMSSSYGNAIELFLPDKKLKKRIMSIKTDSTAVEDPKPEPHPLLQLLQLLQSPEAFEEERTAWRKGGLGYGHHKLHLLEAFHQQFDEARARRQVLESHPEEVHAILEAGAKHAQQLAAPVMEAVRKATGLSSSDALS